MYKQNETSQWRQWQIGGGQIRPLAPDGWRLQLPPTAVGYADAQIDDYGREPIRRRAQYPWKPGVCLQLWARFSHPSDELLGTAGFGFWNAPFGDAVVRWPALPQACWFFYGSAPNDLPLAAEGAGRGWFVATLDASRWSALRLAPLAPFVMLANRWPRWRRRWWPWVQQRLGISFRLLPVDMGQWHLYRLDWLADGCRFYVDGRLCLHTPHSPQGPLGFVCWLDNQYMRLTADGRVGAGTLATQQTQWLEVADLTISEFMLLQPHGRGCV